jgi:hypothetical protein
MKKILLLICCCFLFACKKDSTPIPDNTARPLQIVITNITTTLTIYNFSIIDQSSEKLIDVYAQTKNNTYSVNVHSGDILKINYFLELEGPSPAVEPVLSFIYEGGKMITVTNNAGIVSGSKYIIIP